MKKRLVATLMVVAMSVMGLANTVCGEDDVVVIDSEGAGSSDEDLILKYSFDGNYENDADGTVGDEYGRRTFGEGVKGEAIYLNGQSDYVIAGNGYNIPGSFTMSVWVKPDDSSSRMTLLSKHAGESGQNQNYNFSLDDLAPRFFVKTSDNGNGIDFTTESTVPPEEWSFVSFTYEADRSKLKIFVNGEYDMSFLLENGFFLDGDNPVVIGMVDSERLYSGWLDEMTLYGRAFSEEEVRELYQSYDYS